MGIEPMSRRRSHGQDTKSQKVFKSFASSFTATAQSVRLNARRQTKGMQNTEPATHAYGAMPYLPAAPLSPLLSCKSKI